MSSRSGSSRSHTRATKLRFRLESFLSYIPTEEEGGEQRMHAKSYFCL